jgi:hypothetical protein
MNEVVYGEVGAVSDDKMLRVLGLQGKKVIEAPIDELKEVWQKPLWF